MKLPTPQEVEVMMIQKMGGVPEILKSAKTIDPNFLVEQAVSSKMSIQSENNPFDFKTSMMIAFTVAIVQGSKECIVEQTKRLKNMGITKEELAFLIKIIKHAQSSIVMEQAKSAFDTFTN